VALKTVQGILTIRHSLVIVPLILALLTGCRTTVNTTVHTAPRLERTPQIAFRSANGSTDVLSPEKTVRALTVWAGRDPARLARASALVLQQAQSRPVARTSSASGFAFTAARLAWLSLMESHVPADQWLKDPTTQLALAAYNAAVSTFVEINARSLVKGVPAIISTPAGQVSLTVTFPRRFPAGYYDKLLLSDQIQISGFRNRVKADGLGVALVGIHEITPDNESEVALFPACGVASALSCVIDFAPGANGAAAQIHFIDSKQEDTQRIGGSAVPLAADFTAPLAFSFGGQNDLLVGIRNLLNVGVGTADAGIYFSEPFDPKRIPVLLIHGLSSSPIVWRNVANEAMRDPLIRKNFQFLYAYYSTGAPITFSAAQIKQDMELIRKEYGGSATSRGSNDLVIVGYSMGGVIAQILVTDIGDRLWDQISNVPFDQVKFDPQDIPDLRSNIFWTPLKGVQQVIFIATPHRGTRMADAKFARFAAWLIHLPGDFVQFQQRVFKAMDAAFKGTSGIPSRVTGLDGLSAKSVLFPALDGVPFEPGVKYYSIIGDRGRGDAPNSTDGIVGYWSSHLPGAQSELIVPMGHDAQASPLSENEIFRILRENITKEKR
jgi:pimeloyl-ACP methyl ester carboxylesterase